MSAPTSKELEEKHNKVIAKLERIKKLQAIREEIELIMKDINGGASMENLEEAIEKLESLEGRAKSLGLLDDTKE